MKVLGLDEKEYKWSLDSAKREDSNRSGLHLRARELIKSIYKFDSIYEDITLPGSRRNNRSSLLYADFFLPLRKLIVEVNGSQHDNYCHFFHKNKLAFYKAKARDNDKKAWCELNGISIVYFNHDETDEQWREKLNER